MAASDIPIPNDDQTELLIEMGIDPEGYMVLLDNEDVLWMKHYKTGNECTIRKNKRVKRDGK